MGIPTAGLAFLAGLASFLSPCVLSLVPAYIGYLGGRTAASLNQSKTNRWIAFTHGLAFSLGFSLVFVAISIPFSLLGTLLYSYRSWISTIGGFVVIIFGIHLTGIFRIPFLEYDLRPQTRLDQRRSYLSSFLMGIFFSAGWTPCTGPTLGAILTLASSQGSILTGISLLSAYSCGLAIPFLIAAVSMGWVTSLLRNHQKIIHTIEIIMGVLLIIVGVMMIFGVFELLARLFPFAFIDFNL